MSPLWGFAVERRAWAPHRELAALCVAALVVGARCQLGTLSLPLDGSSSASVLAASAGSGTRVCLVVSGAPGSAWPGGHACAASGLPAPSASSCAALLASGTGTGGGSTSTTPTLPTPTQPNTVAGCGTAAAALAAAVSDATSGACASCGSNTAGTTGAPASACATACPTCVAVFVDWLAACSAAATLTPGTEASATALATYVATLKNARVALLGVALATTDCVNAFLAYVSSWTATTQPPLATWLTATPAAPAPPPTPPSDDASCTAAAAAMATAVTTTTGVCGQCASNTGTAALGAAACATACPACVNALMSWTAACRPTATLSPGAVATVSQLTAYSTQLKSNSVVGPTGGDCIFAFSDLATAWGVSGTAPTTPPWVSSSGAPSGGGGSGGGSGGGVTTPAATCLRVSIWSGTAPPYIPLASLAVGSAVGGAAAGGDNASYSLGVGSYVVHAEVVNAAGGLSSPTGSVTDTLEAFISFALASPTAAALAALVAPPPPPPLLGGVSVAATLQLVFPVTATVQPTLAAAMDAISAAVTTAATPVTIGGTDAGAIASNVRLTCDFSVQPKPGGGTWPPDLSAPMPLFWANLAAAVAPLSAGTASARLSVVTAASATLTLTLAGIADTSASNLMPLAAAACGTTPTSAALAAQMWYNAWVPPGVKSMQLIDTSVATTADVNITAGVATAGSNLTVATAVVGALGSAALTQALLPFPPPSIQQVCLTTVGAAAQCQPTIGLLISPANATTPGPTPNPPAAATEPVAASVPPFVLPTGLVVPAAGVPPGPPLGAAEVSGYLTTVAGLASAIASAAAAPGGTVDATAVSSGLSALAAVSASAAPEALLPANVVALANITASLLATATDGPSAVTLTAANVDMALNVLTQVAAAGAAVSTAVATNVVAGLSILVQPTAAALNGTAAAEVYGRAGAAVAALATSMAAAPTSLCAAGAGAATATAPGITVSVECNAPVFSAGLSVPGSTAAVAPLPAGVFAASTGADAAPPAQLVSTFYALAFDPHSAAAADGGSSATEQRVIDSVVRLQFHDAATGAELVVANLSTPIQITLPITTPVPARRRALLAAGAVPATPSMRVSYWDVAAQAYSSGGIVTLPNPAPAGAVLTWRANFSAASDADLPLAWALALPGCTELVLNCSDAWEQTLAISLDPEANLGDDVVTCGGETAAARAAASGLMRVFVGAACPLWRPAAETGCSWDLASQAFAGAACVYASTAQMATRHTTDFGVGPMPRIAVASPSDLVALQPSMLRQLRLLITLLTCLFGGMHILAAAVNVRDQRDMRKALARARSAPLGCTHAGGLHLWRFTQAPLPPGAPLGRVGGSAVEFAALVGFPYGRMALAIPAELFGGTQPRHATGRPSGVSATALRRHHDVLLHTITRGAVPDGHKIASFADAPRESAPTAEEIAQYEEDERELATRSIEVEEHPEPDLLQISSTALMHAFQQSWCLQSSADVLLQQRLYIALLTKSGVDPGGVTFTRLFECYKSLLMGHIAHPTGWLLAGRVFRCVLLAQEGCYWEPSDALAVSLQASDAGGAASEVAPPRRGFQLVRDFFQSVVSAVALGGISGLNQDTAAGTAAGLYESRRRDAAATKAAEREAAAAREQRRSEGLARAADGGGDGGDEDADDPLHYNAAALERTVPDALAARFADDATTMQRVWATACACSFLQAQVLGWLSSEEHEAPRTLVDDASAWLTRTLGDEGLHASVDAAAHAAVARWAARHDALVSRSRAAHISSRFYAVTEAQRATCAVINALINRSPTISMVASFYSVGRRRWMSAFMLVSVVLASLLVEIWLFWSRSQICCGDARQLLGCARDDGTPCRGFDGTCAELAATHAPFAAAVLRVDGSARARPLPACAAFPDGSARDTFAAAVIAAACALPVATLVATLFNTSMATDADQQHARVRLLKWPLWARLAVGRVDWLFAALDARAARTRRIVGRWWATSAASDLLVRVIDAVTAILGACGVLQPRLPDGLEPAPPGKAPPAVDDDALRSALAFDAMTTRARYAAFYVLYAYWAIFSWLCIVYGSLIYSMLGADAEENFVRAFAGGVGLGQLAELREFGKTTLYMVVLVALLDALWVMPNVRWLEAHLDFASVQASALRRRTGAARGRWITYLRHNKAVA